MPSRRFSTRSRKLENTTVPSFTVTRSIVGALAIRRGRGRLRRCDHLPAAFAQQRHVENRLGDDEFGDLRAARPHARQRHVGLDLADGQAAAGVAVPGILQRDVVQRHVQRRPDADFRGARDRQPIAGLAFDPGLDLRRQIARGNADDQQQDCDHDHGGDGGPGDFQYSHVDIPDRATGIELIHVQPGVALRKSIPEGETAQSRQRYARGAAKLCDLWHTSRAADCERPKPAAKVSEKALQ